MGQLDVQQMVKTPKKQYVFTFILQNAVSYISHNATH